MSTENPTVKWLRGIMPHNPNDSRFDLFTVFSISLLTLLLTALLRKVYQHMYLLPRHRISNLFLLLPVYGNMSASLPPHLHISRINLSPVVRKQYEQFQRWCKPLASQPKSNLVGYGTSHWGCFEYRLSCLFCTGTDQ